MNNPEPIVYLVDDEAPVLKALTRLLRSAGFQVMSFSSANRFLEQHAPGAPGCIILDLAMPDLNGLELQQKLATAGESLPIIFLTGQAEVSDSVKAMKLGAADFLTKPVERESLVNAVRAALERDQATRVVQRQVTEIRRRLASLTPREYEVFEHVISGKLNKQTAAEIGAAEKTIKVHRARVMVKMQVKSVAELVWLADRAGITQISTEQPLPAARHMGLKSNSRGTWIA